MPSHNCFRRTQLRWRQRRSDHSRPRESPPCRRYRRHVIVAQCRGSTHHVLPDAAAAAAATHHLNLAPFVVSHSNSVRRTHRWHGRLRLRGQVPLSRVHGTVARVWLVSRECSGTGEVPLKRSPWIPHANATLDIRSSVRVGWRSRMTHLVVVLLLWRLRHYAAVWWHSGVHLVSDHPHVRVMRLLRIDIHLLLRLHSKLTSMSWSSLDGRRHFGWHHQLRIPLILRHPNAVASELLLLLLLDGQHRPRVSSPLEVAGGRRRVVLAMGCHHLRLLDLAEDRPHVGVLIEDSLQLLWLRLVLLQRTQRPID